MYGVVPVPPCTDEAQSTGMSGKDAVAVHAAENTCTHIPDHTYGWQSLSVNDKKAVLRAQNRIRALTPVVSPIAQHML